MGWTASSDMRSQVSLEFDTLEEAVAYAGFLARSRPVERVQILDCDGSVALEEWLARPGKKTGRR